MKINNMKFRVDIRRTKRGKIIESFWCNSFDSKTRKGYFVDIYQYFGKRLIKVNSIKPNEKINNNIQESYCSYEVSKLLKEKGFRTYCKMSYWEGELTCDTPGFALEDGSTSSEQYGNFQRYYAPTHQIAIEWLRVNFGFWINYGLNQFGYGYMWSIIDINNVTCIKHLTGGPNQKYTLQEATEAALLYILTNLIKMNELDEHGKKVWKHKTNKRLFLYQSYSWVDTLVLLDETECRQVIDTYKASTYNYDAWTPMSKEEYDSIKLYYKEIYK